MFQRNRLPAPFCVTRDTSFEAFARFLSRLCDRSRGSRRPWNRFAVRLSSNKVVRFICFDALTIERLSAADGDAKSRGSAARRPSGQRQQTGSRCRTQCLPLNAAGLARAGFPWAAAHGLNVQEVRLDLVVKCPREADCPRPRRRYRLCKVRVERLAGQFGEAIREVGDIKTDTPTG